MENNSSIYLLKEDENLSCEIPPLLKLHDENDTVLIVTPEGRFNVSLKEIVESLLKDNYSSSAGVVYKEC